MGSMSRNASKLVTSLRDPGNENDETLKCLGRKGLVDQ